MTKGKVGRSTVYNIAREEKAKRETFRTLCLMLGIDLKTGQLTEELYTNTEVNDLRLLACERLFSCLPEVTDFAAKTPIPPWQEGYWNMLDMAKRQTGNLPRSMAVF